MREVFSATQEHLDVEFRYFEPHKSIWPFVSSYYFVSLPSAYADIMRAEIVNIRFILSGSVTSDLSGERVTFTEGQAILCGPTYKWSNIEFAPNTSVLGAAITPLGWCRLFGYPASEVTDAHTLLSDVISVSTHSALDAIFEAPTSEEAVKRTNNLFSSLVSTNWRIREDFLETVTAWIVDPEPNELDHLMASTDLSVRQVERLCKAYFGASPKRTHRKFRALHAANRLTWQDLTDWRDVARAAYYDQAHFIREFKQFNGRTPKDFMKGQHILVRMTLEERLKISHGSPFSLIG